MSPPSKRPVLRPVRWNPPAIPERARQVRSEPPLPLLRTVQVGQMPEDVLLAEDGSILTGVQDGRIMRVSPDLTRTEVAATVAGPALGLEHLPDGRLLVCAAHNGLLAVDLGTGEVEVLVDRVEGVPMLNCDNASVTADGTIYFSDASKRFGFEHWKGDLLEHSGTGRLIRRDPHGGVEVVLSGLQFANGVVLAPDESYVLVAETGGYRVTRLWLSGERSGRTERFADVPGFPDNLTIGSDGLVWVGLPSTRDPKVDLLHRAHPWFRRAVWRLPERLQPAPLGTTWVQAYDLDGSLVHDLQAPGGEFHTVTGVREQNGTVYLGSIHGDRIAVLDLDPGVG